MDWASPARPEPIRPGRLPCSPLSIRVSERLPASPLLTGSSEALPCSPLLTWGSEAVFCNSLLTPVSAVLWQGGAGGAGYAENANPAEEMMLAYAASAG